MPIHDWASTPDAVCQDFQLGWAVELSRRLKRDVLPAPLYSLIETPDFRPAVGFVELSEPDGPMTRQTWEDTLTSAVEEPPRATLRSCDDRRQYACRVLTVRDENRHPVAAVLWVTRQDVETPYRRDAIVNFAVGAITRRTHLMLIDVFHPVRRGGKRFHELVWERIEGDGAVLPSDKPLTVASYNAGDELTAYVEPLAVTDRLPDMPLFLAPDLYLQVPLEATYAAEWDATPQQLRNLVVPPGTP
jgi:hypothetical protein